MSTETAFIGAKTALGDYWMKRRPFDYSIHKENFNLCYGKQFQLLVFLDPAIANGNVSSRENIEHDSYAISYLVEHMHEIRAEHTVFITTCDVIPEDGNEESPLITESEDPFVQNRIKLYQSINHNFGRVLNVHVPQLAISDPDFSPLLFACDNPPKGKGLLDFNPNDEFQFYFPERIIGDVERCIPMGISSIIPAAPAITTKEICEALAPKLAARLKTEDLPEGIKSQRTSVHSFHWLDPQDGYFVTKEDQIELLQFYFGEQKIKL